MNEDSTNRARRESASRSPLMSDENERTDAGRAARRDRIVRRPARTDRQMSVAPPGDTGHILVSRGRRVASAMSPRVSPHVAPDMHRGASN